MEPTEHLLQPTLFDIEPAEVLPLVEPHGRHAVAERPAAPFVPVSRQAAEAAAGAFSTRAEPRASTALLDAPAGPAWAHRLAVFDLETTGIDVETSRIVTANVSIIDHLGVTQSRFDWMADPGIPIPAQASAVHGVSTERAVAEGRYAPDVIAEIVDALTAALDEGLSIVIYNAPYDLTLLDREARRHGITPLREPLPVVDPLVIDKALDRYRKGKRTLEAAALHYEVDLFDAHDAGADAIAAGRVAQALALRFEAELDITSEQLHHSQVAWARDQSASFQDYMRRTKDPTFTARAAWPIG
ncbi:exonuclease domain-containing protein [Subtercola endophyticus]|uniref:exonuclease domain-containing protein n=1 Tax=Subtercola endophyticus TaxID=2895559 RepID=UPI0028BE3B17|nr:exonuclease domain-containing protein [Subtercola endophyticus]